VIFYCQVFFCQDLSKVCPDCAHVHSRVSM
jgi:hypothetical protein